MSAGTGEVLELRVHGVSGTSPQDLLDRPLVEQVAGDRIAGFYRPRLHAERTDDGPTPFAPARPGAPALASYNWGGLTSGSRGRALWLMLLPLTLVNLAPRARPVGAAADSSGVRALWYFARILALALTCLYVVTGIGVGTDLVAWQCSGGTSCTSAAPDFVFHDLSYQHRLSVEHMLLIGAAVPVVQLLVLWFVSARTANRYERTVIDEPGFVASPATGRPAHETPLSSPDMWRNAAPVRRLRALHMQVGFALVLWSVVAVDEGPRTHWYEVRGHWWALVPIAIGVYGVVVLAVPSFTDHAHHDGWRRLSLVVWTVLGAAALVQVLGLSLAHRWVDDDLLIGAPQARQGRPRNTGVPDLVERTPVGGLPFYQGTVLVVCAAAIGLLLAVLAVVAVLRLAAPRTAPATGDHRPVRAPLGGFAAAAFAALAVFLAGAFSAGTYMFVASWLDTGSVRPSYRAVAQVYHHFTVPAATATATVAYALAIAALLVIALGGALVIGARFVWSPGGEDELDADHPDRSELSADEAAARSMQIRRAMYLGRLVDRAPWFVAAMVGSGTLIVGWFGIGMATNHAQAPDTVFGTDTGWSSAASLGATGTYFAVFTVIGLVGLGSLAVRVPATRRTVAILWDVAAFWPRLGHPLAAPCYAERTVPDLVTFITHHRLQHSDAGVVLAAHSQGTVISAAVIRQLAAYDKGHVPTGLAARVKVVPQVALLTFGCVLRRLYGRWFPVWFGPAELHELETILTREDAPEPRWINLWRHTDYLGGQVTDGPPQIVVGPARATDPDDLLTEPPASGPVDWEWHSPDPPAFARRGGDTTFTKPGRHSDFWADESGVFQLAAARLADAVRDPQG